MNIMNYVSYWIPAYAGMTARRLHWITVCAGRTAQRLARPGTDLKSVPRGSEGEITGPDRGNVAEGVNEYNELCVLLDSGIRRNDGAEAALDYRYTPEGRAEAALDYRPEGRRRRLHWITVCAGRTAQRLARPGTDLKSVPRGSEGEIPGPDRGNAAEGMNEYNE